MNQMKKKMQGGCRKRKRIEDGTVYKLNVEKKIFMTTNSAKTLSFHILGKNENDLIS